MYDYNGTAVAHGWSPPLIGRNLSDIIAGFRGGELLRLPGWEGWSGATLHANFMRAARAGGGYARARRLERRICRARRSTDHAFASPRGKLGALPVGLGDAGRL